VLCGSSPVYRCRHQVLEQPDILVDNMILQTTIKQKYLGLIFDHQLTWSSHVSNVCKKIPYYLHLVSLHMHVLPVLLIKLLVDSLVLSHIQYALPVWGLSLYQHNLQHLQRLQNHGVCLIFSLVKFDRMSDFYKQIG